MNNHLHSDSERKLIALGNKRYYCTLALTVAWIILVLAGFAIFMITTKRSFNNFRNYLFLILCVLPFFPFGAHKVLFSKSFYATVSYGIHGNQFESLKWAGNLNRRPEQVAVLEITFKKDNGKEIVIAYKKSTYTGKGFHYSEGDRVFFVRGLKYPYKFPAIGGEKFTCPVCGTTIKTEQPVCSGCRLDYTKLSDKKQIQTESETS